MQKARPGIRRSTRLGILSLFLAGTAIFQVGTGGAAQAADVPPNPLDKPGWTLDRNDEFNGSLDSSLWITNYLESRTPEWRSRARYGFRNNALVLRIDNDQPTYYSDNPMKVSSIQTGQRTNLHKDDKYDHSIPTIMKYTAQYGYFEIRAKSSARSGIHTAFWLVGKQDTWEQRGEVDIMEHAGIHGRSRFNWNLFRWSDPNLSNSTHSISVGFDMTSEMHIYALEWTPTQLKLYVDNVLKHTINQSLRYPAAFLLGIYENAGWTGSVDPSDSRPKEFVVDYFRAYRKADTGTTTPMVARHSGKCADVVSASTANGAEIIQYTCNSGPNQQWQLRDAGSGYYQLVASHSGKCLDVANASTANGARLQQSDCHTGNNQQWQLRDAGSDYKQIVARHSGKCIDVVGASTANNARLVQYDCHSGSNQQWRL